MGIPVAPLFSDRFIDVVEGNAESKGMLHLRATYLPHPIAFQTVEECRTKILGIDPVSGSPVLEQIAAHLTRPLNKEEQRSGFLGAEPTPRLLKPDTPGNLERLFQQNGWTDGLPIVLPTEKKVAEMLKGTNRRPDEIVGQMAPSSPHRAWSYTVEQVAVNAVMAGARPEYFPVILAVASTGQTSLFTSTNSWARMLVVSGPIAEEIAMNGGLGAMGPWNEANSTIGRAWTLISKNLGNSKAGVTYMGTQGNSFNYNNITFAENEAELPMGWDPLHVRKGFQRDESIISLFNGLGLQQMSGGMSSIYEYGSPDHLSQCLTDIYSTGPFYLLGATLVMEPLMAKDLKNIYGFDTVEKLVDHLQKITYLKQWEYWELYPSDLEKANEGIEPYASWLKLPPEVFVPVPKYLQMKPFELPGGIPSLDIVVVGGQTNIWSYFGDFSYTTSASVDAWR